MNKHAGLFIMPRNSSAWRGAEAMWVTVAGWAAAAERKVGAAWVLTTDRIASPSEALQYPLGDGKQANPRRRALIPTILVTLLKDLRLWLHSRRGSNYRYRLPAEHVAFVWEQHDLFPGIGYLLARRFGVPFIMYVHAPQVWESAKWGVRRPGWGWLLERLEARSIKRADVVACVSSEVRDKLVEMGVPTEKVIVSPMAVDLSLFKPGAGAEDLRRKFGLQGRRVIGWTGSFRSFHGLDILVHAFEKVHARFPDTALLLVGDGFERATLTQLVSDLDLGDSVIFAGRQPFAKIPKIISVFDIAIVSARSAEGFHYSPLKLREYLAAGKPSIAPRAGEIPETFRDGVHLLMYEAGDIEDIAEKMGMLLGDAALMRRLTEGAAEYVRGNGTWDVELTRVLEKLQNSK